MDHRSPDQEAEAAFSQQLLRFIRVLLPADADAARDVGLDTYLFADGLINSMRILDLVAFVESTLEIQVRVADVTMEHFRTPRTIARYFAGRSRARGLAPGRGGPATGARRGK
jgi:hypothetical protein